MIKYAPSGTFVRHFVLGTLTYIATLIAMYALTSFLSVDELVAYAAVQVIMFAANFQLARSWVFRYRVENVAGQLAKFVVVGILFRVINWLLYSLAWGWLGIPREVAVILSLAALYPLKYLVHKVLIFPTG